jgi:deuterolysin
LAKLYLGGRVPFLGIRKRVKTADLSPDAFTPILAGETIEMTVDMATVHNLSEGGTFKVSSYGAIPYAPHGSTTLTGQALAFSSNELEVVVDGAAAAQVPRAFKPLSKRTAIQGDCSATQKASTISALQNCQRLASAASTAALSGSAEKFREYFKSTSTSVRGTVAARLSAVAQECGSSTSGITTMYCTDVYGACDGNTLAYTSPSDNAVINCPIYYNYLPVIASSCHAQDMATTTLHEFTHAPAVFTPGTDDNAYGYSAATALSSAQAVLNADTYALYANGEFLYVRKLCTRSLLT